MNRWRILKEAFAGADPFGAISEAEGISEHELAELVLPVWSTYIFWSAKEVLLAVYSLYAHSCEIHDDGEIIPPLSLADACDTLEGLARLGQSPLEMSELQQAARAAWPLP